jgi:beta-fructofuranosidase
LFFLYASRALRDPEARHHRASIGHAVSTDLTNWERVSDAVVHGDPPAFDDMATWTGSVVQGDDGLWYLFYTGATSAPGGSNVQRIGCATSTDLVSWTKSASNPVLEADCRWYERLDSGLWHDEAFRDPFVFRDPDGDGWHMLITARAVTGPTSADRGVIGHATSPDLVNWTLREPLTPPGVGFGQIEVTQVEIVDGKPVLLFSSATAGVGPVGSRADEFGDGGIWAAPAESLLGPYDLAAAQLITGTDRYVGKLVKLPGRDDWMFLAFDNVGGDGRFVGEIGDPVPASWDGRRLRLGASQRSSDNASAQSTGE